MHTMRNGDIRKMTCQLNSHAAKGALKLRLYFITFLEMITYRIRCGFKFDLVTKFVSRFIKEHFWYTSYNACILTQSRVSGMNIVC